MHYTVRRLTAYQTAGKHVWPTAAGAYRAAAPDRAGAKLLALLRQVELLEEEWLGDEQTGSTPLLLSLAVNADSLATGCCRRWPTCYPTPLSASICRLKMKPVPGALAPWEVVGAVSIQPQALPSCGRSTRRARLPVRRLKGICATLFPNGVTRSALLKAPVVAFDHLDDMHRRSCSKTSTCRRAACPAISSTRRRPSCSWRARHHLLYDPAPADRERAEERRAYRPDAGAVPAPDALLAPLCAGKPHDAPGDRCAY